MLIEPQLETVKEDVLNPLPSFPRQPTHAPYGSSKRISQSSTASSSTGGKSFLSVPSSQDWDIIDQSDNASFISNTSFLPPLDTAASSVFSYSQEMYPETPYDHSSASQTPFINPADLSGVAETMMYDMSSTVSLMGDHNSYANGFSQVPSDMGSNGAWPAPIYHDAKPLPPPSTTSSRHDSPAKVEKAPVKFACTVCKRGFASKGDWKRHEGSQCEPQKSWICMLGDSPAIATESGLVCAFCEMVYPGRSPHEMIAHLEKEHKIGQCIRKAPEDRSFRRKDKLKTHLQRVHTLSEYSSHWENWHQCATTQDKSAWGCGFCGVCLFTWEGKRRPCLGYCG